MTSSLPENRLELALAWGDGAVTGARVAAGRPLAARLLNGRPVGEALALVPRLFSLCGTAQGVAARVALEAALGLRPRPDERHQRLVGLWREVVGEHLWRLALDWPRWFGTGPRLNDFPVWRCHLLQGQALGGAALPVWADFQEGAAALPALAPSPVQPLPGMDLGEWADFLLPVWLAGGWEEVAAAPALSEGAVETGPLARLLGGSEDGAAAQEIRQLWDQGRRPAARLAARCAELTRLAAQAPDQGLPPDWVGGANLGSGTGLARVETARGPLLHILQVKDERILHYGIIAPTEWNFHPQGAFTTDVTGLPAPDREAARHLAEGLALSLDPCVEWSLTWDEGGEAPRGGRHA